MLWLPLLALASPDAPPDPVPSWLAGCWETVEAPACREVWSEGRAGVGLGHVVCGVHDASWEHLWLGDVDGTPTLRIHPKHQEPHDFPLVDEGPRSLVFADEAHDFPKRIVYRRTRSSLVVQVEGHPDGAEAPASMTLSYQRCGDGPLPEGGPPEVEPPACTQADPWVSRQLRAAAKADAKDRGRPSDLQASRNRARGGLARGAVAAGAVCSPEDAWHAGLLLQRTWVPEDSVLAFPLLMHACQEGYPSACPHAAGAWDGIRLSRGLAPWFGGAYRGEAGASCVIGLDPAATDADRARFGMADRAELARQAWRTLTGAVPADASYEALEAAGHVCAEAGD